MSIVYCTMLSMTLLVTVVSQTASVINIYTSDSQPACNKNEVNTDKLSRFVAFSVGKKGDFAPKSTSRSQMDHEFYNKGGYFNMQTSIFTAPVSGVYAFYFGASGIRGKVINLRLYAGKPEKDVARTYNYNTAHGQASGSVIIEMKEGQQASLWLLGGSSIHHQDPPSTHLNGYLLSAS